MAYKGQFLSTFYNILYMTIRDVVGGGRGPPCVFGYPPQVTFYCIFKKQFFGNSQSVFLETRKFFFQKSNFKAFLRNNFSKIWYFSKFLKSFHTFHQNTKFSTKIELKLYILL